MYKVDNAVIMAAGTASRFAPLSYERPKALIEVKGEVLIERQIKQLLEAGIKDVYVVVGYKKECFLYLKDKYGVKILDNDDYLTRNNNGSIYAAKDVIKNTYICSSDNYFFQNPFETEVEEAYYAGVYSDGHTNEWCMAESEEGYINDVTIGGSDAWFMLGHCFWDEKFSEKFLEILDIIYDEPETVNLLWESIYMKNLDTLKMKIRKYPADYIFEFDTLDELREFDDTYVYDTRSEILKNVAGEIGCQEKDITEVIAYKSEDNSASGFSFKAQGQLLTYDYKKGLMGRERLMQ
ncbi:MAG: NTP transferase domain-containing protein [Pseudobutyrivibrio sp.]|nr:NTP transferase domain-containing protein [Pseudobutyrivibrio sp.]